MSDINTRNKTKEQIINEFINSLTPTEDEAKLLKSMVHTEAEQKIIDEKAKEIMEKIGDSLIGVPMRPSMLVDILAMAVIPVMGVMIDKAKSPEGALMFYKCAFGATIDTWFYGLKKDLEEKKDLK